MKIIFLVKFFDPANFFRQPSRFNITSIAKFTNQKHLLIKKLKNIAN